jgi:hypothetical protein
VIAQEINDSLRRTSVAEQVLEKAIELNPNVPRPNFLWYISLPLAPWKFLDTHPAHADTCIDRLSGDFVPGMRLRAGDRKVVRRRLGEVIAAAQEAGVLLGLVLPGVLDSGEVSSAAVLLRWHSVAPERACVDPVLSKFSRDNPQVATLDGGGKFVIVERESVAGSVTDRRRVFHVEGFVPVVGSSWFLVISASVPEAEMVSDVRAVVERMIQSLRVYPDITDQPLTQEFGHEAGDAYFTPDGAVLVSEGV